MVNKVTVFRTLVGVSLITSLVRPPNLGFWSHTLQAKLIHYRWNNSELIEVTAGQKIDNKDSAQGIIQLLAGVLEAFIIIDDISSSV
jgi:hypothetical protein